MDFSKFRQSGDLSDITVVIGNKSYRLHKFPLFARSDYFCTVVRNAGVDTNGVELKDFPGGPETFEVVADFCYNIKIDITKENVVELRCAAQFLQMTGDGNLTDLTQKFLHDAITSAKFSRCTTTIVGLLKHCSSTGNIAARSGIVDECIDALLECWLRPSTKFMSPGRSTSTPRQIEDRNFTGLTDLPDAWFVKILARGKEKGVPSTYLAHVSQQFLTALINRSARHPESNEKSEDEGPEKEDNDHVDSVNLPAQLSNRDEKNSKIAELLDTVLLELPEDVSLADFVTPDWLIQCLKIATAHDCKCTNLLIKTAGEMFRSLSPEELCSMSPSIIHNIIAESLAAKPDQEIYSSSCALVDLYLQILLDKGQLTSDIFKLLVSAVPKEHRESDDQLYFALESVLQAENKDLSPEVKEELIHTVDLQLVEDSTLQRALNDGLVSAECVAKEALKRCAHLREELEGLRPTGDRDWNRGHRFPGHFRSERHSRPTLPWSGDYIEISSDSERTSRRDNLSRSFTNEADEVQTSTIIPERDIDSLPTRVKAVSPYTYRPISVDRDISFDDDRSRYHPTYRSPGNLRTPRTRYPAVYQQKLTTHRI